MFTFPLIVNDCGAAVSLADGERFKEKFQVSHHCQSTKSNLIFVHKILVKATFGLCLSYFESNHFENQNLKPFSNSRKRPDFLRD